MLLQRKPSARLLPFVKTLWVTDGVQSEPAVSTRERVLPTALMHLAIRLSEEPLHLFEHLADLEGYSAGHAIVGGARATYYIRDISKPSASVGAQLYPGAARYLFGAGAEELAGRHTRLNELWGRAADAARERLHDAPTLTAKLDTFEVMLSERLPAVRGLHPAVAEALERLNATSDVRDVVNASGYSHRGFIALFKRDVGLTPKLYARVARFQTALATFAKNPELNWTHLALSAGYSDQPHFNRDFREFCGISPNQYKKVATSAANHVPLLTDSKV